MTALLVIATVVLVLNGLLMVYLNWAFWSPRYAQHRLRAPVKLRVSAREQNRNFAINSAVSSGLIYSTVILAYPQVFFDGDVDWLTLVWQPLAVLALYDFLYYAMHRWFFHHRKVMRFMHVVHHKARYPSARESLWIHPLETVFGVGLLLICTWLIGPIHNYAFAAIMGAYTSMNMLIHSGIKFPAGHPLAVVNTITEKHFGHHMLDMNKNFASLTPLWDRLLGTDL